MLALLSFSATGAGVIYKCTEGGRINFTSDPMGDRQNCQPLELRVVEPNPVEVARQLEQKRLEVEKDREKDAESREKRKAREHDEALRRARSAEEAMRLLRESPPTGTGGRTRSWTGQYPHRGPGEGRRFVVQGAPVQTPDRVAPVGAELKR